MARFQRKRLDHPDEVREYRGGRTEVFELDDFVIGRMIMEPGWHWKIEIRAGIHTGEVQLVAGGVRGLAVHIASRILALAGAGEILVSSTTRELAAGSDLTFTSRGRHALKGIAGDREVFALAT